MMKSPRERGSVTPLVAIFIAGGVLLGMLTFAVDAGQIMWERRQTQNAADASALALAQSCAKGNCVAGADNLAGLVAANTNNVAPGRDHVIERQCGRNVTSGTLPACTNAPSLTELRECPPLPAGISPLLPQVEVRVRAEQGGQPWIPNPFARASGGTESTNVTSCARAAWGIPATTTFTSPITISACEWQKYSTGGMSYVAAAPIAPWPGYGGAGQPAYPLAATQPNTAGREIIIKLHDPGDADNCAYKGKDTAGGFGYLDSTTTCLTTITTTNGVDYWANIDTGNSATVECRSALDGIWSNGPVIDLPVFDCLVKSNSGPPSGGIPADCGGGAAGGAQDVLPHCRCREVLPQWLQNRRLTGAGQPRLGCRAMQWL
ncbi:MAG: pilus assembly protein TadG-related protein [Dermatophilaceae bacterium]